MVSHASKSNSPTQLAQHLRQLDEERVRLNRRLGDIEHRLAMGSDIARHFPQLLEGETDERR